MTAFPDDAPVDFLIITALEEERDAVLSKLPNAILLPPSDHYVQRYYWAELSALLSDGSTGNYRIVVTCLLGMGRVNAATATKDALSQWKPHHVLLVGIAGGVSERKVKLGDLLISEQIVDYEVQKVTENGPEVRWQVYRSDPRLLNAVHTVGHDIYKELLTAPGPKTIKTSRHIGPIASGDKVIAVQSMINNYRNQWPALLGVEMEAGGVAAAIHQSINPPGFLMIRGVSDLADKNKDSRNVAKLRSYACDVAASYTIALLKKGPVPFTTQMAKIEISSVWKQFGTVLEEKVKDFVGRDYVFKDIDAFIADNPNGYFTLQGYPGEGKSTILAKYVQTTNCIAHFNMRSQGINTPRQFLESVCSQLIERYKLNLKIPDDATQNGAFLSRLLKEVSDKLGNAEKLIVAVDALDEVEQVEKGANILFLPSVLPKNVYFVLTSRPLSESPLVTQAPHTIRMLADYGHDNLLNDIRRYISNSTQRPLLRSWLTTNQLSKEVFVEKLAFLSENNFMYLYYVLPAIEGGIYKALTIDVLPKGLTAFYEDHWRRMGMGANPRPDNKIRIIYVLAEVRQPVSADILRQFTELDMLTVQLTLNEWRQFLLVQLVDTAKHYSLYHTSFHDFLARHDILIAAGLTFPDINARIAGVMWNELFPEDPLDYGN